MSYYFPFLCTPLRTNSYVTCLSDAHISKSKDILLDTRVIKMTKKTIDRIKYRFCSDAVNVLDLKNYSSAAPLGLPGTPYYLQTKVGTRLPLFSHSAKVINGDVVEIRFFMKRVHGFGLERLEAGLWYAACGEPRMFDRLSVEFRRRVPSFIS